MTGRSLPCEPAEPVVPRAIWLVLLIVVLSAFWIVKDLVDIEDRHKAFVDECVADGHKRYECEALWGQARGGGHSTPLAPAK